MAVRPYTPRNIIDVIEAKLMEAHSGKLVDFENFKHCGEHTPEMMSRHRYIMSCIKNERLSLSSSYYPQGLVYEDGSSTISVFVSFDEKDLSRPYIHLVALDVAATHAMFTLAQKIAKLIPDAATLPHFVHEHAVAV